MVNGYKKRNLESTSGALGSSMTLISRLGAKVSRHDPSAQYLYPDELVRPQIISRLKSTYKRYKHSSPDHNLLRTQGALKASSVTFNTTKANMSHESVWFSRPRTYGKGSRQWYVIIDISPLLRWVKLTIIAAPAHTRLVSSANTGSTCAVNVSGKRHTMLGSRRYGFDSVGLRGFD